MKTLIKTMALLSVLAVASCQQFKIDTQMTPEKAAASIRMECSAVDVYYKLYSVDSAAQREAIVALTIPSTY